MAVDGYISLKVHQSASIHHKRAFYCHYKEITLKRQDMFNITLIVF